MPKKDLVIGAFFTDDFYFYFEEQGIKKLEKSGKITGSFAIYNNKPPANLIRMTLTVSIFEPNRKHMDTEIPISFEKKSVHFYIKKNHFNEWLLHPTDWVRFKGPDYREGTSCVYISRKKSENAEIRKNYISKLISKAG